MKTIEEINSTFDEEIHTMTIDQLPDYRHGCINYDGTNKLDNVDKVR